ncbi:LOW QUALITY PROTEIN: DNA mismatch repair protein MutL [Bacillus sp. JCM 19046]|nr:LOW QUALITY PROTEIN: DNA mismatch repair protein MutL [Bacillus sp. JCM 19046]
MAGIQQLNDALSNKIAAGEVVERPASIVKELIENAIELRRRIFSLKKKGLRSIRIVDDGIGIEKDELETAFLRHATSKIKTDRDLFSIRTLGFRGEALPSIASVSNVNIQSSTGEAGKELQLAGGEITSSKPAHARRGTTIEVTDLFYNTPARLKYLKTVLTESGHVSDVLNRMALAYPDIRFHYVSDGKTMLQTAGNNDLLQVIAQVYGRQTAAQMVAVEGDSLDYHVSGFVAKPELTRAGRQYMSIYINGRYIRNYKLANAIQQGFHTLLPIGRFPVAILKLEMDPVLIDVNVHPAKLEVRLSKEDELAEVIRTSIKKVFAQQRSFRNRLKQAKPKKDETEQLAFTLSYQQEEQAPAERNTVAEAQPLPLKQKEDRVSSWKQEEEPPQPVHKIEEEDAEPRSDFELAPVQQESVTSEPIKQAQDEVEGQSDLTKMPPLYPVGQMHGTYIVAQNENGMYLVDQHAAQERIKYEYFHKKLGEPIAATQTLLVPMTLEFTTSEAQLINESLAKFEAIGLFLEDFGKNTFVVRAHPTWFPKGDEEETIKEMIEQLLSNRKLSVQVLREEASILMSCKAAIKANRHLRHDEIFQLLETLRRCQEPYTCPHGRPIVIHFSTYELEKMFKRVM